MKLVYVLVSFNRIVVTSISTPAEKMSYKKKKKTLMLEAGLMCSNQPDHYHHMKPHLK